MIPRIILLLKKDPPSIGPLSQLIENQATLFTNTLNFTWEIKSFFLNLVFHVNQRVSV